VILGAGFRHKDNSDLAAHGGSVAGARDGYAGRPSRCANGWAIAGISKARILLHAIFGTQFLWVLGLLVSAHYRVAPQPMPVMVTTDRDSYVRWRDSLRVSVLVVLMCYRLNPRGREVPPPAPRQVTTG